MTTFGDQVYQHGGVPLGGSGMLPVLGGGAKAFFVDPANGADGNSGLKPDDALDTVAAAYALAVDKRGDVIYLLNDGNTSGSAREAAGLTWAKDNTHLVGLCAPSINQRARITPPSTATVIATFSPMLTVSGHGCIIKNIALVQGISTDGSASVGITCSGNRNYFENVSVLTGQHANQGDEASEWVRVTGEENVFESCYIGTDTIARGGAASANVRFGDGTGSQATRNVFRNCIMPMFADDTDPLFVRVSAVADIQRWNYFENCNFINTGSSTLAQAVAVVGSATGKLFFKDCAFYGMANVADADDVYVQLYGISAGLGVVDVGHYKAVDIA